MTHFFNRLRFPHYSRITGIWTNQAWGNPTDEDVVIGHLIQLPDDQDPGLESDFLCSHMPFHVGGFSGRYPDGSPWLFIVQVAPAAAATLVGSVDVLWPMRDGLARALRFNQGAEVVDELMWDRSLLEFAYAREGVGAAAISHWTVDDLVRGLLTECCYAELADVVTGMAGGCAFPDLVHECTGDVFTDVFQRWSLGLLATPDVDDDADDRDEVDVTLADLEEFSIKDLRTVARELDIPVRKRKSKKWRSRERLIEEILEALDAL